MSIGKRIKEARQRRGLTQEELASYVNVSKGTIGNYEVDISSPNESTLIALMDVLNVDANYLYQDTIKHNTLNWSRNLDEAYIQAPKNVQEAICTLLGIPCIKPPQND